MAIQFDATSKKEQVNFKGGQNWTHTCANDATILIVGFCHGQGDSSADLMSSVTYAGDSLTRLEEINVGTTRNIRVELWYLVNPATGANTISATSGAQDAFGAAVAASYSGTDGVSPLGTQSENSNSSATSVSTSITGFENGLNVAVGGCWQDEAMGVGATQTERNEGQYSGANGIDHTVNISDKVGAGTVSMSVSIGTARPIAIIAVPMKQAAAPRQRLTKYFRNTNDPKARIIDIEQGRDVPKSQINIDAWMRSEGPFLMTSRKETSLVLEPSMFFIESVRYDDQRNRIDIESVRETQLESLLRRLGARGA